MNFRLQTYMCRYTIFCETFDQHPSEWGELWIWSVPFAFAHKQLTHIMEQKVVRITKKRQTINVNFRASMNSILRSFISALFVPDKQLVVHRRSWAPRQNCLLKMVCWSHVRKEKGFLVTKRHQFVGGSVKVCLVRGETIDMILGAWDGLSAISLEQIPTVFSKFNEERRRTKDSLPQEKKHRLDSVSKLRCPNEKSRVMPGKFAKKMSKVHYSLCSVRRWDLWKLAKWIHIIRNGTIAGRTVEQSLVCSGRATYIMCALFDD